MIAANMKNYRRYVRNGKPLSDDKLREVMLKIRKGATASLTFAQLAAVLEAIGGHAEEFVTTVRVGDNRPAHAYADDEESFSTLASALRTRVVDKIPTKFKAGAVFLSDVRRSAEDIARGYWHVTYDGVVAVDAIRASLDGKSVELLPMRGHGTYVEDVTSGRKRRAPGVSTYQLTSWLNEETDWVARVNRFLNVEEHVPAEARTRDNTGTCPVCFRNIKLEAGRGDLPVMVLHGYERPRYEGRTVGHCDGVAFPPFELSPAGTEKNVAVLGELIESMQRAAENATKKFDRERIVATIASAQRELDAFRRLVTYWRKRPLPREGEPDRNLFSVGQLPDERSSEKNGRRSVRRRTR